LKLTLPLSCALVLAAGASFAVFAQDAPKPEPPALADLAWLAGTWQMERDGTLVEEHWIPPKAGTMLACGRTIARDKTVFFEFLRIEQRKDGSIYYVAHPAARSPGTDFKLTSAANGAWTFENPEHDFPRLIRYSKHADGGLSAHLEGVERGAPATEDFHYRRAEK